MTDKKTAEIANAIEWLIENWDNHEAIKSAIKAGAKDSAKSFDRVRRLHDPEGARRSIKHVISRLPTNRKKAKITRGKVKEQTIETLFEVLRKLGADATPKDIAKELRYRVSLATIYRNIADARRRFRILQK